MDYTPAAGTVTMFSTTWCGYCRRLKTQFDAQGIGYTEINIEEVEGTADLVEKLNGGNQHRSHPALPGRHRATNPSALGQGAPGRLAAAGSAAGIRTAGHPGRHAFITFVLEIVAPLLSS